MLDNNSCAQTNILTSKEMANNSPTRGSVMLLTLVLLLLSRKIGLVDGHKVTVRLYTAWVVKKLCIES